MKTEERAGHEPKFKVWTLRDLRDALRQSAQWIDWEIELMDDFHAYAQTFGGSPGCNVFEFALRDALRVQGTTLEQFRAARRERVNEQR